MKQPEDSQASQGPGTRPPDYAILVCASDRIRERFPDSALSLSEVLQNGKTGPLEPEADLEAEP